MKATQENQDIQGGYVLKRLMVPKNNEKTPAAADLFFSALHGIFDYSSRYQPSVSFEIVSINKFIQFYFYAPKYLEQFIEGQIYAQYPAVEFTAAEDYASKLVGERTVLATDLLTMKADVYPIKTFQNFDVDPMSGITSILSQLDGNEELWIQVCVTPVGEAWQKKSIGYVNAMRAGRDPNEPMWKAFAKGVVGFMQAASKPPEAGGGSAQAPELSGPLQEALKAVETKTTKLGFETKIRIVAHSHDKIQAKRRLDTAVAAFKQYNLPSMNGFIGGNILEGETAVDLYRSRALGPRSYIFNTEELASIYHLPGENVETPSMDWAGSRKGEPPQNLPIVIDEKEASDSSVIGITNFRNVERKFGIKLLDRSLHVYAIGKTGTGKSTLLKTMIVDDIIKGRGVAVVDPHGDLITDVLEFIPDERINDVIYFSPADQDYPIGFNLLESVGPEYKNIISSGIVGVFKKIFGESWGPRLEYILRNVVLGLLDYPGATMLSIIKVLTDTKYRRGVIDKIDDPVIKDFFLNEYERYDQKFRTEAVAPIQNKVGQFLSSTVIRNIVGQEKSTLDIRGAMDEGKILLLDLSIGRIGEDNSALLGAMLITKIQMAAMSRADMKREERKPFYLYVDEFQNFATDSFAVILSEARKYGLGLMVTNQYIAQMPENVANAVFGNVGTLIVFRVGAADADSLQREFVPVFEAVDLTNLNNYNVYIKMAIDGVTSSPFSAKTIMVDYKPTGNAQKVIEQSRIKYSKPRAEVEEYIKQNSASSVSEGVTDLKSLKEEVLGDKKPAVPTAPSEMKVETQEPAVKVEKPTVESSPLPSDNEVEKVKGPAKEEPKRKLEAIESELGEERLIVPENLQNVKEAEDYDLKKWYFLNRTDFRDATGRSEEGLVKKLVKAIKPEMLGDDKKKEDANKQAAKTADEDAKAPKDEAETKPIKPV